MCCVPGAVRWGTCLLNRSSFGGTRARPSARSGPVLKADCEGVGWAGYSFADPALAKCRPGDLSSGLGLGLGVTLKKPPPCCATVWVSLGPSQVRSASPNHCGLPVLSP